MSPPTATTLKRSTKTPQLTCRAFTAALGTGELEAATACFTRDACLITPDATAVHGREDIRALLAQLIARHTEIEIEASSVLASGEVVLARQRWRIRSDGAAGAPFVQVSHPILVLRGIEGEWKLAILAPWGWGG